METKKTLGARISAYRRARGLKQEELAEALGISPQAVSKWENDLSCPDIMALPKLSALLGVTLEQLLVGEASDVPTAYLPPEKRKSFEELVLHLSVDADGDTRVRLHLPLPLIKVLLESGVTLDGMSGIKGIHIDAQQIITMVERGVIGKLMEVDSSDCHVEIVVE